MAASSGTKINPYSVTFKKADTSAEFTVYGARVELRQGYYKDALWCWVRITSLGRSNLPADKTQLVTPAGTVSGSPYGNYEHWVKDTSGCTAAICLGQPASLTTVTFEGVSSGDSAKKTVKVI